MFDDDAYPVAFMGTHDMALDEVDAAIMREPRPGRDRIGGLLSGMGFHQVTQARMSLAKADAYLRAVPHETRRLAVHLGSGDVHVESLDGGLDPEPVADLLGAFDVDGALYGPPLPFRRVTVRRDGGGDTATCVGIALGTTARNAAELVSGGWPLELEPVTLVKLIHAAVIVGGGRRAVIRGWRRRSDLQDLVPRELLGLRPAA